MNDGLAAPDQRRGDRRHRPAWASRYFWLGGRRRRARRAEDRDSCYTDAYGAGVTITVVLVMGCCALDALMTLVLLDQGAVETNPVMAAALTLGGAQFVSLKLALTGICVVLLAIHHRFRVFRLFQVHHVMTVLAVGYVGLLVYELGLIHLVQ